MTDPILSCIHMLLRRKTSLALAALIIGICLSSIRVAAAQQGGALGDVLGGGKSKGGTKPKVHKSSPPVAHPKKASPHATHKAVAHKGNTNAGHPASKITFDDWMRKAWISIDAGNTAAAGSALKSAGALKPGNPAVYDATSYVYLKQGDDVKAERAAEMALSSGNDCLVANLVFAQLDLKAGDSEKARVAVEKHLATAGAHRRAEAQALLSSLGTAAAKVASVHLFPAVDENNATVSVNIDLSADTGSVPAPTQNKLYESFDGLAYPTTVRVVMRDANYELTSPSTVNIDGAGPFEVHPTVRRKVVAPERKTGTVTIGTDSLKDVKIFVDDSIPAPAGKDLELSQGSHKVTTNLNDLVTSFSINVGAGRSAIEIGVVDIGPSRGTGNIEISQVRQTVTGVDSDGRKIVLRAGNYDAVLQTPAGRTAQSFTIKNGDLVKVRIDPVAAVVEPLGMTVRPAERQSQGHFRLMVTPAAAGHLLGIYVEPKQAPAVAFPNEYQQYDAVAANQEVAIPPQGSANPRGDLVYSHAGYFVFVVTDRPLMPNFYANLLRKGVKGRDVLAGLKEAANAAKVTVLAVYEGQIN